ncbi:MAG: alpha/beta fold hydrolase [Candidatus Helarchaeota archaeon]
MPVIICAGHHIRYEEFGQTNELPPMIFLHGWQNNVTGWYRQIQFFSKHAKVYAYDQLGHGKSEKSRKIQYSIDLMEAVLYQFIKKLEISKPVIIGHSIGGILAQYFAIKHPDLLSKLILLCTGPGTSTIPNARILLRPLVYILARLFKPINYLMIKIPHHNMTKEQIRDDFRRAFATDPHGSFASLASILEVSFEEEVKKLRVPILFITGTHDLFTENLSFYQKLGAQTRIFKDAEHTFHYDSRYFPKLNQVMLEFISR